MKDDMRRDGRRITREGGLFFFEQELYRKEDGWMQPVLFERNRKKQNLFE